MTTSDVPAPAAELRILEPLDGDWTCDGHTRDSVLGPGVPVRSRETFSWLDGGYFLVQTYETVFGDEPAQKGINYWRYDEGDGRFRIVFFSNNGPYSPEGNHYEGIVEDGALTFEGPARFRYALDDAGRILVDEDGSISVSWWLRDETGTWQPWMENSFIRLGAAPQPIKGVSKIVVPVEDQDAAKDFWTAVGFGLRRDETFGDERWVEIAPPDGGPVLVLSLRPPGEPRPEVPETLPHSPIFFTCEDIQHAYRVLTERGVEFAAPPRRMHFGWWSLFRDPDGTRYALGQW